MTHVSTEQFLLTVAAHGIGLDPHYGPPQTLVHLGGEAQRLRIKLPTDVAKQAVIVDATFDLLPLGRDFWMYKRHCPWVPRGEDESYADRAVNRMLRALGVPAESGALLLNATDRALGAGIALLIRPIAWSVAHDIFVLPVTGEIILYFDHHEAIYISCRDATAREELDRRLASLSVKLDVE